MKKIIFLLLVGFIFTACSNTNNTPSSTSQKEIVLKNGILLSSKSDTVEVSFKDGESKFFDMYMLNGSPADKIVMFAFYKACDVTSKGEVKKGSKACRIFQLIIPSDEVIEDWSKSPLVTRRADGSRHLIYIRLVNQPN